jgi:hypothetical protein
VSDPTPYDASIDWLLNSEPAALGECSGFGSFINSMERGSVNSGGMPSDLPAAASQIDHGLVAKSRKLMAVWRKLTPRAQAILMARYVGDPRRVICNLTNGNDLVAERMRKALDPTVKPQELDADAKKHAIDPEQPNTKPTQLAGILVFLSWRIGTLQKIVDWFGESWNKGYPPRYERRCNQASAIAHRMWRDAYQSEDPKLREFAAGFKGVPMIKKPVARPETRTHYHEYASDGAVPDLVDVFGAP